MSFQLPSLQPSNASMNLLANYPICPPPALRLSSQEAVTQEKVQSIASRITEEPDSPTDALLGVPQRAFSSATAANTTLGARAWSSISSEKDSISSEEPPKKRKKVLDQNPIKFYRSKVRTSDEHGNISFSKEQKEILHGRMSALFKQLSPVAQEQSKADVAPFFDKHLQDKAKKNVKVFSQPSPRRRDKYIEDIVGAILLKLNDYTISWRTLNRLSLAAYEFHPKHMQEGIASLAIHLNLDAVQVQRLNHLSCLTR